MAEAPEGYVHTTKDGRRLVKQGGEWVELKETGALESAYNVASEFAGGVNRTMAGTADFFTADPINAVANLAGSDFRVPTFRQGMEAATGGTSGFMQPGTARDVTQAAGEWGPAFANPSLVAGRLGAGARQINKALEDAAPSIDDLKKRAGQAYGQFDEINVTLPADDVGALAQDILSTMKQKGLDPMVSPQAQAVAQRLAKDAEGEMTLQDLEVIRKIAGGVSGSPHEQMLSGIVKKKIDDFYLKLSDDVAPGASQIARHARKLVQQRKKAEEIEKAIELAGTYASGLENGLRLQFQQLERRIIKGQLRGFSAEEVKAIRKVGHGGSLGNVLKVFGKMGPLEGGAVRTLIPGLGGFGTGAAASALGADAMTATLLGGMATGVGQAARNAASKLTQKNARLASAVTRAGSSGRTIVGAYLKTVPKKQQSSQELASLLYSTIPPQAIRSLEGNRNALVANAAIMASLINEQVKQQAEQPADPVVSN